MSGRLGIVAAMESEVAPLVRGWQRRIVVRDGTRVTVFESGRATVAVGGIGSRSADLAAKVILDTERCTTLISCGLAGALSSTISAGEVLHPEVVIDANKGAAFRTTSGKGILVTVSSISGAAEKHLLAQKYSADCVDMEAAAVAEVAAATKIPFLAIKAVSDSLAFPMPDMNRFIGSDGRFAAGRFMLHTLRHPSSWKAVAQLARNSALATRNLCACLQHLIDNELAPANAIDLKHS